MKTPGQVNRQMPLRKSSLTIAHVTFFVVLVNPVWGQGPLNCAAADVLCVDDTTGPTQEYATVQAAADATKPGDTVLVHDGSYGGFRITVSGTQAAPVTFKANGIDVVIHTGGPNAPEAGIFLRRVSYVTVEGFIIYGANFARNCIGARDATATSPMTGLIIRNNICAGASNEGFYLSQVSNSLVEGNVIANTGLAVTRRGHGIYLANAGSDNTTLRGNTISVAPKPESSGIHFNGDLSVGGDGIISGLLVEKNIVYSAAQNGLNMDGVQDSTIQNNLVFGNTRHALRAYRIDGAQGPRNLKIINNTFVVPGTSAGWAIALSEDGGGHVIFNNILIKEGTGGGSIRVDNLNFSSNHNAVIDRFSRDNENTTIGLATWRTFGPDKDQNSFLSTSSDLFVNPAADNYQLRAGSPAIDAGISALAGISVPSADIAGIPRPRGPASDMGAHEWLGDTASLLPPGGQLRPEGVVNAASFLPGPLTPGEIISIFGSGIGPATGAGARLGAPSRLSTFVADTQVLFDGIPAPLFFVRSDQVNAQVPYGLAGRSATALEIIYQGKVTNRITLPMAPSAPGVFTLGGGKGQAVVLNPDGSLNSTSRPAARGDIIVLYATGEGQTTPQGEDGKLSAVPYPLPLLPVSVSIGDLESNIRFAGSAPGFAGLLQINAQIPLGASPGDTVPLLLRIGQAASQQGVTGAIR